MKNDEFSKPYDAIPKNVNNVQAPQFKVPLGPAPVFPVETANDFNQRVTERGNQQRRAGLPVNAKPMVNGTDS